MKRKGQIVRLKNLKTHEIIEAKVIQHDSIQGVWAEYFPPSVKPCDDNDWRWYHPTEWKVIP